MLRPRFGLRDATAATVVTVRVEVPFPPATDAELNLQAGGTAVAGVTAQVRFTAELKPPAGATVTMEVAVPPADTVAGVSTAAASENVAAPPVTDRLRVAVWVRLPEVPLTVTL
jgi:hypothetical protein